MALCILAAAKTTVIAASAFTLSWIHSAQKSEWSEDWSITDAGLELTQARIKGSGAGMEPPDDARLVDGWWVYKPELPPRPSILLASSGATQGGWQLCAAGGCREIGKDADEPVLLSACDE
ncbi:MAG: DUF1850 domain-containing protein [Mesorhizobium sp.]